MEGEGGCRAAMGEAMCSTPAPPPLTPLWALKSVYCIGVGSSATLWKYITVFYHHVGMNTYQIGIIQMLNPTVNFCSQMAWAALCDRLGSYKEVLVVSSVLGVGTVCCLLLPEVQQSFHTICVVVLLTSAFLSSRGSVNDSMTLQVVKDYAENQRLAEQRGELAGSRARLPSYGAQRLWGAAGWGGASLIGGRMMDLYGVSFMFGAFAVLLMTTVAIMAIFYPKGQQKNRPGHFFTSELCSFEVLWFFANLFLYGIFMSLVETFLFIFLLRDFDGTSTFLLGGTIAMMCVFEVPVFLLTDRLFPHVRLTTILSVCHVIFAVRCVLYSILPRAHPSWILLIEPLHGITFAMMWTTAVEYGKRIAPAGAEATMQALVNGLYYQLAIGFGSLFWGRVTEEAPRGVGFRVAFRGAAVAILAWCVLWNLGWCVHARCRRGARAPLLTDAASCVTESSA
jgi:MFS family permease